MRVAVDASFLGKAPSGTRTYLEQLLRHLPDVAPDLEVVRVEPTRLLGGRVRQAAWELAGVGVAAGRARPAVTHVPTLSAPVWVPGALVATVHDVIPLVLGEYRASAAMRAHLAVVSRTVRRARAVLVPSRHAAGDVERVLDIPPERIHVTPEAVDGRYRPAEDPAAVEAALGRLGVRRPYVFNVGGLDVRKGVPLLLEAFARVRAEVEEPVQLVVAGAAHTGNPTVYPPLEPVVARLGLGGDVLFTGRVSEEDKLALYRGAAVYATPSRYEGFGLTALEAMACGAPVVAADRTSLPEVVGDAGLLVDLEVGAWADALRRVLTDGGLAASLRERGLRRAAGFSWRETARLTAEVYRGAGDVAER